MVAFLQRGNESEEGGGNYYLQIETWSPWAPSQSTESNKYGTEGGGEVRGLGVTHGISRRNVQHLQGIKQVAWQSITGGTMCLHSNSAHNHKFTHTYTRMHAPKPTRIHTHTQKHTRTYKHTHTHAQTLPAALCVFTPIVVLPVCVCVCVCLCAVSRLS
jgi:hypothetical protein